MHLAERFSEEPGDTPHDAPDAGRVSSHFGSMAPRDLAKISLTWRSFGSWVFYVCPPFLGRKNNVELNNIYPPAFKHGVPESSQFVPWFYLSNLQREWDFHGFSICFSYFPMIFPVVSRGISPCQPHFGWHPPEELRSSQTFWRSAWTPRRISGGSRSITSQWRKIRTAGASLVGRWRGYPGYIYSMYLKII